jgi:hypothetical protein
MTREQAARIDDKIWVMVNFVLMVSALPLFNGAGVLWELYLHNGQTTVPVHGSGISAGGSNTKVGGEDALGPHQPAQAH